MTISDTRPHGFPIAVVYDADKLLRVIEQTHPMWRVVSVRGGWLVTRRQDPSHELRSRGVVPSFGRESLGEVLEALAWMDGAAWHNC